MIDREALEAAVGAAEAPELLALAGELQGRACARLAPPPAAPREVAPPLPRHVSVAEAAKMLAVSPGWLYHTPDLPFVRRLGRRVVVDVKAAAEWLKRQGGA